MKILITGGCGFIGSNLSIFLKEKIKENEYQIIFAKKGIINNNNNISVYILTSSQFQTAHNHH